MKPFIQYAPLMVLYPCYDGDIKPHLPCSACHWKKVRYEEPILGNEIE